MSAAEKMRLLTPKKARFCGTNQAKCCDMRKEFGKFPYLDIIITLHFGNRVRGCRDSGPSAGRSAPAQGESPTKLSRRLSSTLSPEKEPQRISPAGSASRGQRSMN